MAARSWPRDPEHAPTAEQIARAFVAAARLMGDDVRLAEAVGGGAGPYAHLTTRSRWLALAALLMLWPRCGVVGLAGKLGAAAAQQPASSLSWARRAGWWSDALVDQVAAAI